MQTKRNIGIDLLKIVSMLMIVTLHMLGHGGVLDNMPPMSRCYQVAWLIEIACYGAELLCVGKWLSDCTV